MTQRSAVADTICRTIELGVAITDAAFDGEDRTHVFCQVMDPFHVAHLAAEKLTVCRQRVQQDTCGYRGRTGTRSTASVARC